MEKTLLQVLPLAAGATFSPSGLLLVMAILSSRENPRRKALSFILGAALMLTLLAFIILIFIKPKVQAASHPGWMSGAIDIGLAALLAGIVVSSALRKKKGADHKKKKKKIPFLFAGFSFMLINTSSLVLFIAACKLISESRLEWPEAAILLVVVLVVTMALISFPVLISYAMPKESQRILGPVTSFMSKHGNRIAQVYILVMAAYLLFHGIRILA